MRAQINPTFPFLGLGDKHQTLPIGIGSTTQSNGNSSQNHLAKNPSVTKVLLWGPVVVKQIMYSHNKEGKRKGNNFFQIPDVNGSLCMFTNERLGNGSIGSFDSLSSNNNKYSISDSRSCLPSPL